MRKSTITPLRLASTTEAWRQMDQTIDSALARILKDYDGQVTESFMFIVDILTNPDIDRIDRECALGHVQKLAFTYSPEFEQAQQAFLDRINPGRAQSRKAVAS